LKFLSVEDVTSPIRIESFQTRPVKLKIQTVKALPQSLTSLDIEVNYRLSDASSSPSLSIRATLQLNHVSRGMLEPYAREAADPQQVPFRLTTHPLLAHGCLAYQFTYLDFDQTVQYATAIPPISIDAVGEGDVDRPVVMYLHGAGAGVEGCQTLQQNRSWVIQPMGRTSWGYDWQVASQTSATFAVETFSRHLYGLSKTDKSKAARIDTDKIMTVGHSNGGQGVYHYASHRPDKMIGVVVGAGYISLAEYVSLTWQLGRHFNDAALNGILRSSLNAFENDLFASNLAGLPFLIKHGSDDDNVPLWHSKEMATLITTWNSFGRAPVDLVK
jgi:predicted peptidase